VRHTFTHFHLQLRVMVASVPQDSSNRHFTKKSDFRPMDLPTVMRKVWSIAAELQ
jgi:A/G-specific adenine glycosylase